MVYKSILVILLQSCLCHNLIAQDQRWLSALLDNDVFVGEDNGYTNGFNLSSISISEGNKASNRIDFLLPLRWSLSKETPLETVTVYSFGQSMGSPEDITVADPPLDDIPYSGALLFNNMSISVYKDHADSIGIILGMVGPSALGEQTQKFVHKLIDADEPQGWDTQLHDEAIFQLSRGRVDRLWESAGGNADFLSLNEIRAGTLSSQISSSALIRYGKNLDRSFASALLSRSRTSNPVAVDGNWYAYIGVGIEYVFNEIFTDGNTYKDSRSIDTDSSRVGLTSGLAISWDRLSVSFAINDFNITDSKASQFTRFGTISVAWKY